ncbi:hypothetical protein JCM39068_43320 [Desulfocastanea catecholica]
MCFFRQSAIFIKTASEAHHFLYSIKNVNMTILNAGNYQVKTIRTQVYGC